MPETMKLERCECGSIARVVVSNDCQGWQVECTGCFQRGPKLASPPLATVSWNNRRPAQQSEPEIWPDHLTGACLGFEGGLLNINRDGSGNLAFAENDLEWEQDDESGKDYRYVNIPKSEFDAIRDFLDKWFPRVNQPHPIDDHELTPTTVDDREPSDDEVGAGKFSANETALLASSVIIGRALASHDEAIRAATGFEGIERAADEQDQIMAELPSLLRLCELVANDAVDQRAALSAMKRDQAERGAIEDAIKDPNAVHVNLLRGSIARPSPRQIWHIYQRELLADMPSEFREELSAGQHMGSGKDD